MEGLEVSDADLTVYIHPSRANKVRHAILRQLSSLLFTYVDVFDGILLSFEVHTRSRKAKILPGLVPYFGVQLRSNLLLFSPKPDMVLEGKVVKLGKESIHVVVLGFCSAAIMSEDIRDEFKYKIKDGTEVFVSKFHKRHTIKAGSIIRFLVKRNLKRHRVRDVKKEVEDQQPGLSTEHDQSLNHNRPHKFRKRSVED